MSEQAIKARSAALGYCNLRSFKVTESCYELSGLSKKNKLVEVFQSRHRRHRSSGGARRSEIGDRGQPQALAFPDLRISDAFANSAVADALAHAVC